MAPALRLLRSTGHVLTNKIHTHSQDLYYHMLRCYLVCPALQTSALVNQHLSLFNIFQYLSEAWQASMSPENTPIHFVFQVKISLNYIQKIYHTFDQ